MDEPKIDKAVVKEIGDMLMQIQNLLKQGLVPLKVQVDHAIKNRITDEQHLDKLFDSLLDYTQIEEGLAVFKRLGRYCYPLYPQMTVEYIDIYREHYDPDYAKDEDDNAENK